jgi:predicted dehydrogenase
MDSPQADLRWICDLRSDALEAVQRRHPKVRATSDIDEMLADPELDAVVVATPISSHYSVASAALTAGKHIWVEKPLAASSREALALIRQAHDSGLVLLPGHTFLYSPPVVKIRDLISSGELGEIYSISMSRVNLGLHQSDASVVWDLAPHDFAILRYWLDNVPAEVSAMTRSCVFPDIPDVAFLSMRFDTGTIAHLELSWLSPSKLRRTTIIGSSKMVVYDDTSQEPVRIFDSGAALRDPETFGEYRLTYRSGDIVSPRIDATEPLALELADFCAAVVDGSSLRSTPEIGLEVVHTIEAVELSLAAGGSPVRVSRLSEVAGQPSGSEPEPAVGDDTPVAV